MGFSKPCVSNEDKVEGLFDPGRVDEGHDVVLADFWIEVPVELVQGLDMSDARHAQKSFDLMLPSVFDLRLKEVGDGAPAVSRYLIGRGFAAQFVKQGFKS